MTITEVVQKAMEAEQSGVPVDWRAMCITVHNAALEAAKAATNETPELPEDFVQQFDDSPEEGNSDAAH